MASDDKQPLLPTSVKGDSAKPAETQLKETIIDIYETTPPEVQRVLQRSRSGSPRRPAPTDPGAPNFISSTLPLFGLIAAAAITAYIVGRWRWTFLCLPFIMYGVWEVVRRRVERFEAYHRNRIDREIAKEKLEYHMETCEWINHIVDRFWSVLEPVVSSQFIDKANLEMAKQCPSFLNSLELEEFTLGSSAPHILGARVYPQTGSDVIHLDLDVCFVPNEIVEHDFIPKTNSGLLRWNNKIVLKARVGKGFVGVDIPVLLKEILFYGRLRAQIQLAPNIPFVQRIEIGFLEQPKIDFILKPLKSVDIMDLPGLSRFLFSMINNNVAAQLVNPNKLVIDVAELLKDKKKTRMNSIGVLRVNVRQTRGLKDPEGEFVRLMVAGRLKGLTGKLDKDEVAWNEVHYILIPSLAYPVTFNLESSSSGIMSSSSGELLGTCKVGVEEIAAAPDQEAFKDIWKRLITRSGKAGKPELNVGVQYYPAEYLDDEELPEGGAKKKTPDTAGAGTADTPKEPPKYKSGILQITLHGAKDLPVHPSKKDWSTFVQASCSNCLADDNARRRVTDDLNPFKFRSTIKKKTNAPSWEETFEFLVVDYTRDKVKLVLCDAKDDVDLGTVEMTAEELLDRADWFTLRGVDSGRLYLSTVFKPVAIDIDDPAGLRSVPSIGVASVRVVKGTGFQKTRGTLDIVGSGKDEYYAGLSVNGRIADQTSTVRTAGEPMWDEYLTAFIKAPTDTLEVAVFEAKDIRRDAAMGVLSIPLKDLMTEPGKIITAVERLKDRKGQECEEGLEVEYVYHSVAKLGDTPVDPSTPMVQAAATALGDTPSNTGILALSGVEILGFTDKSDFNKLKIYCDICLSDKPEDPFRTKTIRVGGTGEAAWESNVELLVREYDKTALWLVFWEDNDVRSDSVYATISIPVKQLVSGQPFDIPDSPLKARISAILRPIPTILRQPVPYAGKLKLELIRASVIAVDSGGTSDPFVTVKVDGKAVFKTKVIKKTITPEWKERCHVDIEDRRVAEVSLEVSDWNQVMLSKSLGQVDLDLMTLPADTATPLNLKLQGVPSGVLSVSALFETMAGQFGTSAIGRVPVTEKGSPGLVGTMVGAPVNIASGAAGAVVGAGGAVFGAGGAVVGGAASAVTSTGSAIKSGMSSVFGLGSSKKETAKEGDDAAIEEVLIEQDLKLTIKSISCAKELGAFDCSLRVMLDGKEKLHRTKTVKKSANPAFDETFEVTAKQLKGARAIEFHPETSLTNEQMGIEEDDRPVFRLDLSHPQIASDEAHTFTLNLNDREDDPPMTLTVNSQGVVGKAHSRLGSMFGRVKFGK